MKGSNSQRFPKTYIHICLYVCILILLECMCICMYACMVPTYLPTYLRCSTASASIRDARTLFLRACPRCSWFSPIHFSTFLFINSMYVLRMYYVNMILEQQMDTLLRMYVCMLLCTYYVCMYSTCMVCTSRSSI